METVTISSTFRIVLPQKAREALGLRTGDKARVLAFRNRIEVIPVRDVRTLRGYLKGIDTSFERDGDLALEAAMTGHEERLALADSIIYATAQKHGAVLWTQDAHFAQKAGVRSQAKT